MYVTHDQHEAMELAHRVAVMGGGKVRQLGAPAEIYSAPTSRYVANFIGTTNEIEATVRSIEGDTVVLDTAAGQARGIRAGGSLAVGDRVVACFRPEYGIVDASRADGNVWPGIVERQLFLGATTESIVRLGPTEQRVRVMTLGEATHREGDDITLCVPASRLRVLPAEDRGSIA